MPPKNIYIKIIGSGKNRFGLRLLNLVAKIFHINLETYATETYPFTDVKFNFYKLDITAEPTELFRFDCEIVAIAPPSKTHPYAGSITQQLYDYLHNFRAIIPDEDHPHAN